MDTRRVFTYPFAMHWLSKYLAGPACMACGIYVIGASVLNLVNILAGKYPAHLGHLGLLLFGFLVGYAGGGMITQYPDVRIELNGLAIQIVGPIWHTVEWTGIREIRRLSPGVRLDSRLRSYRVQYYAIGIDRYLTPWHSVLARFYSDDWTSAIWLSEDMEDVDELLTIVTERSGRAIT